MSRQAMYLCIVVLVFGATSGHSALVHHWTLDEDTAAGDMVAMDSAGDLGGVIEGAQSVEGVSGNAMSFDGADDVITIENFVPPAQGTVVFWMNPTLAKSRDRIFGTGGDYEIWLRSNGELKNELFDGGSTTLATGPGALNANEWNHVAATYDSNSTAVEIYLDGRLSASGLANAPSTPVDTTLLLGHRTGANASELFGGLLDDVRIYDQVLAEAEIQDVMAEVLAEPVAPGVDEVVALYTLDNDANDSSGNGHDGTVEGAPMFVTPGFDGTGACMQFGGDADRITVDSFDVMGTGITLAAWINPITFMNDARMISKSEGGGTNFHYWAMVLSGTGENFLQFRLRTDAGNTTSRTSGSDPLVANEWTHVAVTWDANDPVMRQYKNGAEIDSFDKAGSMVATGPGVQIGIGNQSISALAESPDSPIRPFDGLLDDVRIYQRGLSVREIRYLAGERARPVDPGAFGLVAFYALDNDANDSSGNGLHGTINGSVMPTYDRFGDPNAAMQFGGASGDHIDLGDPPALQLAGSMTLSAWVMLDGTNTNNGRIVAKAGGGGARSWSLNIEANSGGVANPATFQISASGASNISVSDSQPLPTDEWVHMAGVYKPGVATEVYVNGELKAANTANIPDSQFSANNRSVLIGARNNCSNCNWLGSIDDVGIYERILTVGEIRYLAGYRAPVDPGTENLVAFYPLDNDANDASGNNNHGMPSGDPQFVVGMIGGALEFDGVDDHVDCGNDPSLDITGPIAIGAWVYPTGSGSSTLPRIVDKSNGTGGADPGYKIYLRAADNYVVTLSAGGVFFNSTLAADLNAWNYVAFVADGMQRKLFLNGEWEVWDESSLPVSSSNPLYVGNSPAGARHFQGMIDEVTIYNRALSEPEVRYIAGER